MDDIKPAPKSKPASIDNVKPVGDPRIISPDTPPVDTNETIDETAPQDTDSSSANETVGESAVSSSTLPAETESAASVESDNTSSNEFDTTPDPADNTASTDLQDNQPIVTNSGKADHHKSVIVVLLLVILAALASGAYFFLAKNKIATTSAPSAAAVVAKKDIPNLRYVTSNTGWDKFYPGIDSSANYDETNREIFEGLVRFEGGTKIVPLLATSWTNPDPSTWVFKLQQGVKFHTGRTMTADDVKASFDTAKDSDYTQPFNDTIASVTVDNPSQVTIKTTRPDATLLNKLTNLYIFDTKSGKQNDPINGTGAYTIKPGTTAKTDSLELVAFDDYHGGRPHVRSVSYIGLSDDDGGKAYSENKADLMSLLSNNISATKSRPYKQITPQPLGVRLWGLNSQTAAAPLKNAKVRQALYEALDPQLIAKAHGATTYVEATQIVPKAVPGYNPAITRPKTDVTAAKQLLAQAGYPNGFTMKISYFKTTPVEAEVAEITKEVAQIGVKIQPDPQTDASAMGGLVFGGKTDSYINTQTSDILDSSDVLTTFTNTLPGYKNPQVDDLVSKAGSTLDSAKRITYLQQANKVLMDDTGEIPLYVPTDQYTDIYDPSYVMQQDIQNNNLGVYFWKVYAK